MRFTDVLTASLVASLVAAHGEIPGMPKIFGLGRSGPAKLRTKRGLENSAPQVSQKLHARQGGLDGRCGPDFGKTSCDPGYCCSPAGWCGIGDDYCMAPDCLFEYGSGCDANKLPSGGTTREIPRPLIGDVVYGGEGIYHCKEPGTVAITYDDGPFIYTNDVMDLFASYGMKATFFITGINNNKGSIDDVTQPWPAMIQRMIAEGHQVASHTWSHQNLDAITQEQRIEQLVRNEMAISNIIGKFPTYMRPPYSACITQACADDMKALGYHVSYFDLDTSDYLNTKPELIQNAKDIFASAINPSNAALDDFLAIGHDIHEQTAHNLTGYMLDLLVAKGYRGVTMGECMQDPEANWYRTGQKVATTTSSIPTPTSSAAPFPTATGVTTDGTCGGQNGMTCIGFEAGSCCSQAGWCGTSVDHCGTGCQEGFGTCGFGSSSSSSAAATTSSSAASSSVSSSTVSSSIASSSVISSTESSSIVSSTQASSTESSTIASSTAAASTTSSAVPTAPATVISEDGSCGGEQGYTCAGSVFGNCCSGYGYCGSTELYCGEGCNPLFGNCGSEGSSAVVASSTAAAQTSSSAIVASSTVIASSTKAASSTVIVSSTKPASSTVKPASSTVKPASSTVKPASSTVKPASSTVKPASSTVKPASSTVKPASSTVKPVSTTVKPSSTLKSTSAAAQTTKPATYGKKSQDGTCGGEKGYTCKGYRYGECCSQYGWCGSTSDHCRSRSGCNAIFGYCGDRYIQAGRRFRGH